MELLMRKVLPGELALVRPRKSTPVQYLATISTTAGPCNIVCQLFNPLVKSCKPSSSIRLRNVTEFSSLDRYFFAKFTNSRRGNGGIGKGGREVGGEGMGKKREK